MKSSKPGTYREGSMFSKRYTSVLGAEKSIMLRELLRRKKTDSKSRLLTPININENSSFYKIFGHINSKHRLEPQQLNLTTRHEIFRSNKNSLK